jgi:cell division protein FtsW
MFRASHALILIVLALLTFGVIMVTSAGLSVGMGADDALTMRSLLASRQMAFAIAAAGMLIIGSMIPLQRLYELRGGFSPIPWIGLGAVLLLVAVHVPEVGREVNGARRWMEIGPIRFQPSELAKWGVILVLAWHATRRAGSMSRFRSGFVPAMTYIAIICALIATEDLGTAVLIGMVGAVLVIAGGAKLRHVILLAPMCAAGVVGAVIALPYRIDRLKAFLDPYADPQGIGYHVLQSMAAVSGGGLAGRGVGNGLQKFGYLPEDTTDFIFAIICEELGVLGAATVIFLYAALLLVGYGVVCRCAHPFQRLIGLGVLLTIGLQALINLLVVTGLAPTKGIALPLVSAGGTGWCLTAFSVGLLVSMDRAANRAAVNATAPIHDDLKRPVPATT